MSRVRTDGKQFALDHSRFRFRGVTYGTFEPRTEDGARFPEREQIKRDFASMSEAGFTVVRTYTEPPDDLFELAADWGLHVMSGVFYPDWRYLIGGSRRQQHRMLRDARAEVRAAARRRAGDEGTLALVLGNEIPADVVRWFGTSRIAAAIADMADVAHEQDPESLVTYAHYPSAEYLPAPGVDFVTFNVFLERPGDYRRYLTRLQNLAGDQPLVLGEVGVDAGPTSDGEERQAEVLDWQLRIAMDRGVAGSCVFSWTDDWWVGDARVSGWHFGLTRADRSARPALEVAAAWNERSVADVLTEWPPLSVVICAYNAAETLDECLEHTVALDYPGLEVIVVDDGSTDDTAAIAARHPSVRLLSIPHAGLSVARNAGFQAATSDVVAYLDSDAYPTPEWPYHLVLAFDGPMVAGAGGPNVPPRDDPPGAQQVARAPGGPVHVLLADDRAEHVPGCNMAFHRRVLAEVGGFDPVYTAAGDDVDLCWKVLDRGYEIGFHPAALVWHHRRAGLRPYLRQQRGYGRAEALVEARHPDRFSPLGSARWRGRIYNSLVPSLGRQRVYRGLYGASAYQSVYQGGGFALDVAHQAGVPMSAVALLLAIAVAPFGEYGGTLLTAAAFCWLGTLFLIDAIRAQPGRSRRRGRLRFRLGVAVMCVSQPLVRTWGRLRTAPAARRDVTRAPLPPISGREGGAAVMPADRPRAVLASDIVACLRVGGLLVMPTTGWERYDARIMASGLVAADLVTTAYPEGCMQLRLRRRLRIRTVLIACAIGLLVGMAEPALSVLVGGWMVVDLAVGWWRSGPKADRLLQAGAAS